jgi:plastocyanin/methionine-rich copper-binding protein CopC
MKKLILVLVIIVLAVGGFVAWKRLKSNNYGDDGIVDTRQSNSSTEAGGEFQFATPKKGAHFETSTPAHESVLPAVPVDVVIDFNFDLADNSTIRIEKDGNNYGMGEVRFDDSKLAMRRKMASDAPDGVYTVNYNGCWPDRTCHDGSFQFAIDRKLLESYQDMRGQGEVTIRMSQLNFQPMNLRISKATKVTWVNDDTVEHFVNTDSHPAHSHVSSLNSRALAKGASYTFTFSDQGAYPYHCSAHAANMTGTIVVEG